MIILVILFMAYVKVVMFIPEMVLPHDWLRTKKHQKLCSYPNLTRPTIIIGAGESRL